MKDLKKTSTKDWSNNTGAIDVKIDGSVLEEKSSLNAAIDFSSNSDWGS